MAGNLFHREVDSKIINELTNRENGKTRIRVNSFKVQTQQEAGKVFERPGTQAWMKIYDHTGELFLAYGDDKYTNSNTMYSLPGGRKQPAYRLDVLETSMGGDYGSLRNFKFDFSINVRQPEEQNTDFDKIFTAAVDAFAIGKKICIQYGYKESYDGYDSNVHHSPVDIQASSPGFRAGSLGKKGTKANDSLFGKEIFGEIYVVTKPEFSIQSRNKIAFSISGIGPGAHIGEKNMADTMQFIGICKSNPDIYKVTPETATAPSFITNYDLSPANGRFSKVQNIVDWIDFDVQSHIRKYEKKDTSADFSTKTGAANFGGYAPPPIDLEGDYSNVGFIVFKLDEEYYNNPLMINADEGSDRYVYYVTLQYLTWLFNWTLQSREVDPKESLEARAAKKDAGAKDVYRYLFKCDKETTVANLGYVNAKNQKTQFLPSADPYSVIFNYGNSTTDPGRTSSYGATMEVFSAWAAVGAGILGAASVVAGIFTFGAAAAIGSVATVAIASQVYQMKKQWIIPFTASPEGPQVHDINGKLSASQIQNSFAIQTNAASGTEGNLSNILINRDCIAAILDEMGALKRTKELESEEVAKVSVNKFFKKLFEIIKTASGGNIQLHAIIDPDNTDTYLNKMLIVNKNAPPDTKKTQIPAFNKSDGSTIEMTLKSKIPKAMQVAAATQGDSNIEDIDNLPKDAKSGDAKVKTAETANEGSIEDAKDSLVKNKFAASNVASFAAVLQKFGNSEQPFSKTKVERKLTMFPLTMILIIQGITGFKFGDTITSKMLPPKYREIIKNQGFSTDVIFTVTKVSQRFLGNSWTTNLETVMRFAPNKSSKPKS